MIRVFLAGEGANELGDRAGDRRYWSTNPGVLETLLCQVRSDGWEVTGAVQWKDIHKYRAGERRSAEMRTVLGAVQQARRARCDVIAFVRDRDGSRHRDNRQRQKDVESGMETAEKVITDCPGIIGGVAVEKLEAWLLALAGVSKSESLTRPERSLNEKLGIDHKNTGQMVALVNEKGLAEIPDDAASLLNWLSKASAALKAPVKLPDEGNID